MHRAHAHACVLTQSHTHTHTSIHTHELPYFLSAVAFHNSHGVCVVREHTGCTSIKQGVDTTHTRMHTCARSHASCIHIIPLAWTHTMNGPTYFSLTYFPAYIGLFEKAAVHMINLLWQSASLSMPLHQNYASAMFACVFACLYIALYSFPFYTLIPSKAIGKKSLAIILIHS